jgi:Mn-dependent DtxR family transcriptional regulator
MPRPKFSDDDVLAVICQLGPKADLSSVQRRLSERANLTCDVVQIETRIQRLRDEGLLRFAQGGSLRLTAAGVERLQSLQREPMRPPTE